MRRALILALGLLSALSLVLTWQHHAQILGWSMTMQREAQNGLARGLQALKTAILVPGPSSWAYVWLTGSFMLSAPVTANFWSGPIVPHGSWAWAGWHLRRSRLRWGKLSQPSSSWRASASSRCLESS